MLGDNGLYKQILGEHPQPTVEDKYGVHFEYHDLCSRLMEVKLERENKPSHRKKSSSKISNLKNVLEADGDAPNEILTERTNFTENCKPTKKRRSLSNTKSKSHLGTQESNKKSISPFNKKTPTYATKTICSKNKTVTRTKSAVDKNFIDRLAGTKKVSVTKPNRPLLMKKQKSSLISDVFN
ncbi:unnamed protein product [Blepharisma stoltei]|uniref:Uncharacterized protein n=1 Tax=Blepharisma stoltei TaxID=1481888 RepID=A0AAU9J990_9CILI|nr:unnamed protein product [Blepharisma stoltei]